MTDLVSQLAWALERLSGQCERMRLPGQRMSDAEKNAIAALTAAKAGGWVPIETAPKEESVLILRRGDLYPGVAFLSLDRWHWSSSGGWAGHPTHWQPLPTPPKEQS